jgi:hypothetical protein
VREQSGIGRLGFGVRRWHQCNAPSEHQGYDQGSEHGLFPCRPIRERLHWQVRSSPQDAWVQNSSLAFGQRFVTVGPTRCALCRWHGVTFCQARTSRHIRSAPQNRSGDLCLKAAEVLGRMAALVPSGGDNPIFAALRLQGD